MSGLRIEDGVVSKIPAISEKFAGEMIMSVSEVLKRDNFLGEFNGTSTTNEKDLAELSAIISQDQLNKTDDGLKIKPWHIEVNLKAAIIFDTFAADKREQKYRDVFQAKIEKASAKMQNELAGLWNSMYADLLDDPSDSYGKDI